MEVPKGTGRMLLQLSQLQGISAILLPRIDISLGALGLRPAATCI